MQVERMQEEVEGGGADTDKLSYEIFSILESKFLFGYTDPHQLWLPKAPAAQASAATAVPSGKAAQRGKVCVLCVDGGGGGLRALLAGRALAHLEAALRRASGDLDAASRTTSTLSPVRAPAACSPRCCSRRTRAARLCSTPMTHGASWLTTLPGSSARPSAARRRSSADPRSGPSRRRRRRWTRP